MEEPNREPGEGRPPVTIPANGVAALDIIRTETVLSRLPIHNLSKKGSVNIQIIKTALDGKVELKWIVSYSDRYGQARQLAYKLDTIVINQHIDEQKRPLPKMICLGSLRDVADLLDLGGDTNKVRRALRQNASAFITAKFEYSGSDGSKRTLEADFTRYSVVFTGEQLPDGRKADAVYIILNEPYREVLNNAPVRPLDRGYMKILPPAAQRFYEIVSYKMFSAIKNDYARAKIAYSDYCMLSAQARHLERQRVQDQMAKVLRPHKESGYITAVRYEAAIDAENKPDWILHLTPGPKAIEEFDVAHGKRRKATKREAPDPSAGESEHSGRLQRTPPTKQMVVTPYIDPRLLAHFTDRGITEPVARDLIANRKPNQDVIAQLEMADEDIKNSKVPIRNPAAYRVSFIRQDISTEGFETSAKRKEREDREREERSRRAAQDAREELEHEYELCCNREVDEYIATHTAEFEAIKEAKAKEDQQRFGTSWLNSLSTTSTWVARMEIRKQVPLPTIEEFINRKKEGSLISLKQVPAPPAAEGPTSTAVEVPAAMAEGGGGRASEGNPSVPETQTPPQDDDSAPPDGSQSGDPASVGSICPSEITGCAADQKIPDSPLLLQVEPESMTNDGGCDVGREDLA